MEHKWSGGRARPSSGYAWASPAVFAEHDFPPRTGPHAPRARENARCPKRRRSGARRLVFRGESYTRIQGSSPEIIVWSSAASGSLRLCNPLDDAASLDAGAVGRNVEA